VVIPCNGLVLWQLLIVLFLGNGNGNGNGNKRKQSPTTLEYTVFLGEQSSDKVKCNPGAEFSQ
jgi:hypothetical protein